MRMLQVTWRLRSSAFSVFCTAKTNGNHSAGEYDASLRGKTKSTSTAGEVVTKNPSTMNHLGRRKCMTEGSDEPSQKRKLKDWNRAAKKRGVVLSLAQSDLPDAGKFSLLVAVRQAKREYL